jgi:hypothetical protein
MTRVRAIRPDRDTDSLDGNTQDMGLIVLEAALALAVLIFVIWWTMFSGRRDGELQADEADSSLQPPERGGTRKDIG